jgi:outer membrane beta-barrel protein
MLRSPSAMLLAVLLAMRTALRTDLRPQRLPSGLLSALLPALVLGGSLLAPAGAALAAEASAASEPVIEPRVDRFGIELPRFPSRDFELNLFAGTYSVQNLGAHPVTGLRLDFHITEDFFVEASAGRSKVTDENYRQVLPGGIFTNGSSNLKYYSVSAGVNVLPGEMFVGAKRALASSIYLLAGTGNTQFAEQRQQTFHFGTGMRVLLNNRWALRVDMRDYIFPLDLLGLRQNTHNLELTTGLSFIF